MEALIAHYRKTRWGKLTGDLVQLKPSKDLVIMVNVTPVKLSDILL